MGKTILIVEDQVIAAKYHQEVMQTLGHEVVETVKTEHDAIRAAKSKRPNVILMDIRLEGDHDGVETALRIKEFMGVDIVYVTAYGDKESSVAAPGFQPPDYGYVVKPYSVDELKVEFERILDS